MSTTVIVPDLGPASVLMQVPFEMQTTDLNCGPTALHMVLLFLTDGTPDCPSLCAIEAAAQACPGCGTSSVKLALAAATLGFPTAFYSTSLQLNPANLLLPFYKEFGDIGEVTEAARLLEAAGAAGVALHERAVSLDEVLSHVRPTSCVIALLDMHVVEQGLAGAGATDATSYSGHFVVVVGYNAGLVCIHNQSCVTPQPYLMLPRALFNAAREAAGTDQDFVVVSTVPADSDSDYGEGA